MTTEEALAALEKEFTLMETHDIPITSLPIIRECLSVLRRSLQPVVFWTAIVTWLIVLLALTTGCASKETPSATVTPRTSAAIVPTPVPFDCHGYAMSRLPWKGQHTPVFRAVNDALLPDTPEFMARRAQACSTLRAEAGK